MCPLRNTHNLRVPPLGWVSPAASASAPLGLSAHPYEPAHRPARALSWLTCHSARHRRAPRLQPGAAIVTTLNRPGFANCFAHHILPLWRALCSSSSSPGRSTPPSRRTIPCSSYIMAIRSLGSFVAPRPHMARPPPADSARGRRRGRLHARWTCVILGRLHRAHAHDPRPGPSGLGFSGARREKRVHDGPRSLEQRPPRTRRLVRLKRRFNTAQQLVRDELDRRRDLVAHGTVDGAREELVERVLADIRLARLLG